MDFYFVIFAVLIVLSFLVFFANEKAKETYNVYVDKIHFYYFSVCFLVIFFLIICKNLIYDLKGTILGFLGVFNFVFALCFALYVSAKKAAQVNPNSDHLSNITDICPHCRNHNTSKTRLCEWCGSQIV